MARLRARLRGLLASVLALARGIDAQDVILLLGLACVGYGVWLLGGVGLASVVVGSLLLLVWAGPVVLALVSRPPNGRR